MPAAHPQKERRFAGRNKPAAMIKHDKSQPKFLDCFSRDQSHLVLGHRRMHLIVDSLDVATILGESHDPLKIDHRSPAKIDIYSWRFQPLIGQQNVTN